MSTSQVEKHQTALEKANRIRLDRAKFKHALKQDGHDAACYALATTLREMPDWLGNASVGQVLCWLPRFGESHARRLLNQAGITLETRRLGELSPRQLTVLADALEKAAA